MGQAVPCSVSSLPITQVLFVRFKLNNLDLYKPWQGGVSFGSDLCSKCAVMLLLLTWFLICQIEEFQE